MSDEFRNRRFFLFNYKVHLLENYFILFFLVFIFFKRNLIPYSMKYLLKEIVKLQKKISFLAKSNGVKKSYGRIAELWKRLPLRKKNRISSLVENCLKIQICTRELLLNIMNHQTLVNRKFVGGFTLLRLIIIYKIFFFVLFFSRQ